jgi:hypothetical protein
MQSLGVRTGLYWVRIKAGWKATARQPHGSKTGWIFGGLATVLLFLHSAVFADDGSTAGAPSPSPSPTPPTYQPFVPGLIDAFSQALTSPAYTPPQPGATPSPRRGYPSPFDSPSFFTSDFQIGGTQLIGDPGEATVWPLMKAIYGITRFPAIKEHLSERPE